MCRYLGLGCVVSALMFHGAAAGREWTDTTGHYTVEAEMIAMSDTLVVLKKKDNDLVAVPREKLSKADQEYLKTKAAEDAVRKADGGVQTWTMKSGFKVSGKVVDFVRKEVAIQRRRGKIYVNDRLYDNLPEVYREMLPKVVAHLGQVAIDGRKGFEEWVVKQLGEVRRFTCEGVLLELENGDEYAVPFFLFSDADRKMLEPGWKQWLAADKDRRQQEEQATLLRAQAEQYKRDSEAQRQIAMMQLELQAYDAGLFSLWEVRLVPGPNTSGRPYAVVVPGRNSDDAKRMAVMRNPGYVPTTVARVHREQ